MKHLARKKLVFGGLGLLSMSVVVGCSPQTEPPTSPTPSVSDSAGTAITHVHAITRDAADGRVLLATHEGLFRLEDKEVTRIGPVIDLMGFTVTDDGRYLASGHPGAGTDLPEPVGLIESTDQGETWRVLSRGGESDFHALAAGLNGIVGFDGQLRTSTDGRTWTAVSIPAAPTSIAVSPDTSLLAATQDGLLRRDDDGATEGASWTAMDTPQPVSLAAWADEETIVGAGVDGRLLTSTDGGSTWTSSDQPLGEVTALGTSRTEDGDVETLLVADNQVLRTTDGGKTTEPLL